MGVLTGEEEGMVGVNPTKFSKSRGDPRLGEKTSGPRVDGGGKSGLWDTVNLGGGSRRLILEMSLYISAGRLLHSLRCPLGLGIHRDSRVVFRVEHRVLQRVNYKKKKKNRKATKKVLFLNDVH